MTTADGAPAAVDVVGLGVHDLAAERPVLDDVALHVPPGGSLLVVGPSGSGKSTLVATLAGLVPHARPARVTGTVRVAGADVVTHGPRAGARVLGLVQQDPDAQTCLDTVRAEVALVLENRAVPREAVAPGVDRALAAAGSAHLAGRRTGELSGGQLQRVALAAALAAEPPVLVLDEPTALLDPVAAAQVGALVGEVARRGTTTVVVEHRLEELCPLPDAMLVLHEGRVRAAGPTAQVLADHGAELLAAGCWVPLGTLLAVAGAPGPLDDPATDAWLRALATTAPAAPVPPPPPPAPTPAPVVRAAGLGVAREHRDGPWSRRRRVEVVHDVDLVVAPGEVVGVLGTNGSGKSSLLLGLARLLPVRGDLTTGRVTLCAQHPEHQLLARTVADEVALGPRRAGLAPDAVAARVAELLDRLDLAGLADRSPFRLSGGQQRRLSLAAALAVDADVLLADEPTFGLDRAGTLAAGAVLRDAAARGAGVVVVSHDVPFLAAHADRLVLLGAGRVVRAGRVAEVLADGAALARAGLRRGRLLDRWAERLPDVDPGLLLRALDARVAAVRPAGRAAAGRAAARA